VLSLVLAEGIAFEEAAAEALSRGMAFPVDPAAVLVGSGSYDGTSFDEQAGCKRAIAVHAPTSTNEAEETRSPRDVDMSARLPLLLANDHGAAKDAARSRFLGRERARRYAAASKLQAKAGATVAEPRLAW
jgi:hypothetical protein